MKKGGLLFSASTKCKKHVWVLFSSMYENPN
jgi:hypothetical protein